LVNNKGVAVWSITKGHWMVKNKRAADWSITKGHSAVNSKGALNRQKQRALIETIIIKGAADWSKTKGVQCQCVVNNKEDTFVVDQL
jgi:hypothetical protein